MAGTPPSRALASFQTVIVQDNDPGAVGARRIWVNTSGDPLLFIRNATNEYWVEVTNTSFADLYDQLGSKEWVGAHDNDITWLATSPGFEFWTGDYSGADEYDSGDDLVSANFNYGPGGHDWVDWGDPFDITMVATDSQDGIPGRFALAVYSKMSVVLSSNAPDTAQIYMRLLCDGTPISVEGSGLVPWMPYQFEFDPEGAGWGDDTSGDYYPPGGGGDSGEQVLFVLRYAPEDDESHTYQIQLTAGYATDMTVYSLSRRIYVSAEWSLAYGPYIPAAQVPPGGDTDQVLGKVSGDDYNMTWVDPPSGGALPRDAAPRQMLATPDDADDNFDDTDGSSGPVNGLDARWGTKVECRPGTSHGTDLITVDTGFLPAHLAFVSDLVTVPKRIFLPIATPVSGDFEIVGEVGVQGNPSYTANGGIAVLSTNNATPADTDALIAQTIKNATSAPYAERAEAYDSGIYNSVTGTPQSTNMGSNYVWLRIRLIGTALTFWHSDNGINWTQYFNQNRTIVSGSNHFVGLFAELYPYQNVSVAMFKTFRVSRGTGNFWSPPANWS